MSAADRDVSCAVPTISGCSSMTARRGGRPRSTRPRPPPIEAALARRGWRLTDLLVTHHHEDHVAGIEALKASPGCRVIAAKADAHRIPAVDVTGRGGRHGLGRLARGRGHRHARPHRGPHRLLVRGRPYPVRRRHTVLARLRPRVRGHDGGHVAIASEAARPAGRHRALLRARIHAVQCALCPDGRSRQRRAAGARRRSRGTARRPSIHLAGDARGGEARRTRSCAPTIRPSLPISAWPAPIRSPSSPSCASARTGPEIRRGRLTPIARMSGRDARSCSSALPASRRR